MALRRVSKKREYQSKSAGSKHVSAVSSCAPRTALLSRGQETICFIKSNNSVHPIIGSPPPRCSTTNNENIPGESYQDVHSSASSIKYMIKVRVLHGIDLHIPKTRLACQHAVYPIANVSVNGNPIQSCTSTQHARNHSIWKKHELKFQAHGKHRDPLHSESGGEFSSAIISMHVSLSCTTCSCSVTPLKKGSGSMAIGEVGELQLPAKENEDYEISRFFPVIRPQLCNSDKLLPAGKIKLQIRVEIDKPALEVVAVEPQAIKRQPFALPTNFGEALQLKRNQLKSTIVPQKLDKQSTSHINAAAELLKEISTETFSDEVDADNLKIVKRIGEGIHSCVSRGALHRGNSDGTLNVAIKEFRHQHSIPPVKVLRAFQQEYRVLKRCRGQNGHQHVVELLGVTLQPLLTIIMEYFNRGSLAQCLQDEVVWGRMSIKQKAVLGLKIAQGIAWLHKHNLIHRDIKSHNILVGGDVEASPTVKIGDVGSAVLRQQHEPLLLEEVGSSGYTAPEVFTHQGYDSKVDVWSFGIVLWELFGTRPQHRINPFTGMVGEEFVDKARSGCRPKLDHAHQLCVGPVVEKCWIFDPSQRLDMDEIVNQLEKLCESL